MTPETTDGGGHGALPRRRMHAGPASAFLEADERVVLDVDGVEVLVLAVRGRVFAIGNRCTHMPIQLRRGHVLPDRPEITCPVHQGRYSLVTGEATEPPCETPVPIFTVEIEDGEVHVLITEYQSKRSAL